MALSTVDNLPEELDRMTPVPTGMLVSPSSHDSVSRKELMKRQGGKSTLSMS